MNFGEPKLQWSLIKQITINSPYNHLSKVIYSKGYATRTQISTEDVIDRNTLIEHSPGTKGISAMEITDVSMHLMKYITRPLLVCRHYIWLLIHTRATENTFNFKLVLFKLQFFSQFWHHFSNLQLFCAFVSIGDSKNVTWPLLKNKFWKVFVL